MNTYTFILKTEEGRKCYHIPKAIMEMNYGLPEEDSYLFHTPHRNENQVFYLSDHPRFKKKKDSREAISNNKE